MPAQRDRPRRRRTCLSGKLAYEKGAYMQDCTIHDLSDGGAKILLSGHQSLPAELYLIVAKYCVAYQAKIVWSKFPARGLCFSKSYQLNALEPGEPDFLRQLWLNVATRPGDLCD